MVATIDCVEKSKPTAGNKVSKPLMEKKRRARINQCLDELKTLLESYYSSCIRKRKLEKADILELTVKHLRNLQKIQSCSAAASECPDYQSGFRSCLANFNHYLLMADHLSGRDQWTLARVSNALGRSCGRGEASSTMDSGTVTGTDAQDEARRPASAAGPAEPQAAQRKAPGRQSEDACHFSGPNPPSECARTSNSARDDSGFKSCVDRGASNAPRSVWRPW
ncbi:hairy-related 3 [Menidia menidia]